LKNNLIVSCAPIEKSLTNELKEEITKVLIKRSENVEIRNLYDLKFNPVISQEDIFLASKGQYKPDVKVEQRYVKNADNIILLFPLYQSSMPALMKGYIDRVMCQNFAYSYDENGKITKLMEGKTVTILSPMGSEIEYYEQTSLKQAMDMVFRSIFTFRGFNVMGVYYFDPQNRNELLAEIKEGAMI